MFSRIPGGTDVLITQGPPFGILDQNWSSTRQGCKELLGAIRSVRPSLHVFGLFTAPMADRSKGTLFINAALAGPRYKLVNQPITVDFDVDLHRPLSFPGMAASILKSLQRGRSSDND